MPEVFPELFIPVSLLLDLDPFIQDGGVIASVKVQDTGLDTLIAVPSVQNRDPQTKHSPKEIHASKPSNFIFLRHDFQGKLLLRVEIPPQDFDFQHATYLPSNEILLVCGTCQFRATDDFDLNAKIFDMQGRLLREFSIGDGVKETLVDQLGKIWTTYFDEGISGTLGWKEPIGRPGLIRWNPNGNIEWTFERIRYLEPMKDCYAATMDADGNCWTSYLPGFPIVRIAPQGQIQTWESPIKGSNTLQIWDHNILLDGGFGNNDFVILAIHQEILSTRLILHFQTEQGVVLQKHDRIPGCGPHLGFRVGNCIYLADLLEWGDQRPRNRNS